MFDYKGILGSRTVWANIIGFISFILLQLGWIDLTGDVDKIIETALAVVTGISFLLSTVYRVLASKRIALVGP